MPFVYRLQKILDFRIRKKEEQLIAVQKAQTEVIRIEQLIKKNNDEIEMTKRSQRTADYRLMESYDKYLHHLWEKGDKLVIDKEEAEQKLKEEMLKLVECEKEVKVLEKHKEKGREAYLEEEKAIELKKLSEIAVQRHFQQTREKNTEDEDELLRQLKQQDYEMMEGTYFDEY